MNFDDFLWFVEERESIRLKKEAGLPRPWTDDPILNTTRFCNIDRIHDRGTVRLLDFTKDMTAWEKVFYITLYRSAISSQKFLEEMTGIWFHDYRNLRHTEVKISDARKPYQVFLHSGDSVRDFLHMVASPLAKYISCSLDSWEEVTILDTSQQIASEFNRWYNRRMIFLATEIAKDLTYFFPQHINPDSECRMNIGARMALKKLPGNRMEDKIEILLHLTSLNFSSLEHGLCEWGKYLTRREYLRKHGELKPYWLY